MTVTRIALLATGGTISAVADARRADDGEGAAALARSVADASSLFPSMWPAFRAGR
jgi:L-asparaginase/Glu-tRNA(Gln) amidotransferase subunit D